MGLFKKKHDPIADRAEALNQQIAALEAQIHDLAQQQASATFPLIPAPAPTPAQLAPPASPRPRLRSTAKPRSAGGASTPPLAAAQSVEPIFEEVDHQRLQERQEKATSETFVELGIRQYDFAAIWRRIKSHFRGPATNNPKLVNYLAAGSIQGLRPMRYEKRVARNRFIVLAVFLALALWGILAIFLSKR